MPLWIAPLYAPQTAPEKALRRHMTRIDLVALPILTLAYLFVGNRLANDHPAAATPQSVRTNTVAAAVVATHTLYLHTVVFPVPAKDRDPGPFKAQQYLGRWCFLTRHVLALQAVHGACSFARPGAANALAVILAGFGLFVTVQYFTLVHWHPEFLDACAFWKKERGVATFRALSAWLHVPAACLGICDVLLLKDRSALLAATPPYWPTIVVVITCFTLYYVCLIHVNHHFTGEWPYGLLKPLGRDPLKWGKFLLVQTGVMVAFVTAALGLMLYAPVF